jgi:hypothetical protein
MDVRFNSVLSNNWSGISWQSDELEKLFSNEHRSQHKPMAVNMATSRIWCHCHH